jgi:hypothetical protein
VCDWSIQPKTFVKVLESPVLRFVEHAQRFSLGIVSAYGMVTRAGLEIGADYLRSLDCLGYVGCGESSDHLGLGESSSHSGVRKDLGSASDNVHSTVRAEMQWPAPL